MKINCIIIEDEPLALERVKEYALKVPFLNLAATFDNALDALAYLKTNKVDLVLLDINLGEFSGMQLLESASLNANVILTTAYQEHALKAFDLNVTDYLLKPFTFDRFLQAVDRVRVVTPTKPTPPKNFIFVKTESRLEKVSLREVVFIEGMRDYRRIHTATKRVMTLQTFTDFEQQIPPHIVCRIHKSYMVSISKIDSIEKNEVSVAGHVLPISATYRKHFLDIIDSHQK